MRTYTTAQFTDKLAAQFVVGCVFGLRSLYSAYRTVGFWQNQGDCLFFGGMEAIIYCCSYVCSEGLRYFFDGETDSGTARACGFRVFVFAAMMVLLFLSFLYGRRTGRWTIAADIQLWKSIGETKNGEGLPGSLGGKSGNNNKVKRKTVHFVRPCFRGVSELTTIL